MLIIADKGEWGSENFEQIVFKGTKNVDRAKSSVGQGRSGRLSEFERISRKVGVQGRYRVCRAAREE